MLERPAGLRVDDNGAEAAALALLDPGEMIVGEVEALLGGGASRTPFTTDTLRAVEFMEDPMSVKQGDTRVLVKIPLIIAGIDHVTV